MILLLWTGATGGPSVRFQTIGRHPTLALLVLQSEGLGYPSNSFNLISFGVLNVTCCSHLLEPASDHFSHPRASGRVRTAGAPGGLDRVGGCDDWVLRWWIEI